MIKIVLYRVFEIMFIRIFFQQIFFILLKSRTFSYAIEHRLTRDHSEKNDFHFIININTNSCVLFYTIFKNRLIFNYSPIKRN